MVIPETRFYVAGGAMEPDAPSYVVRRADGDLFDGLSRGEFCYVLTSRQMGKSSLMVRAAARLQAEGIAVARLDLTMLGRNLAVEQWYYGMLSHIGEQLDLWEELRRFWLDNPLLGPLQRWMAALRQVVLPRLDTQRSTLDAQRQRSMETDQTVPGAERRASSVERLVIFIDEIDSVRSLPFSTDEFFAAIRECYNRRAQDPEFHRLTFCLLGVTTPSELIQNTRTTPFNIGRRIELTDFTPDEAGPLAEGLQALDVGEKDGAASPSPTLSAQRPTPNAQHLLHRILYWTGGHPYLTQRLCQAAADHAAENPISKIQNPKSIDRLCEALFLDRGARERDDNLLFVRDQVLGGGADLAALLDLYARVRGGRRVPDDATNPLISLLRLSGIVHVPGVPAFRRSGVPAFGDVVRQFLKARAPGRGNASLQVRNRIYAQVFNREWVAQFMPDAELRRQRDAYRRGLLRASAGAGLIVLALAGLAVTAVQQAETARRRLVRLNVAAGNRLVEEGDLLGSLPWFAEALKLDEGKAAQEAIHRVRLATVLQQCPRPIQIWFHDGKVLHAEFSPDGQWVVTASDNQTARVWDVATGRPVGLPLCHQGGVGWAAFSPEGRRVVTAGEDGKARVWNAVTGRPITPWLQHGDRVQCAAFSPDGQRVVTASWDRTARVWDAATGQAVTPPLQHGDRVVHAEFDTESRRVLTASWDNTARIWDIAADPPVARTLVHDRYVTHATFSPDGRRVAIASGDGRARVWDSVSGEAVTRPLRHSRDVVHIAFSPDGRRVLTASNDGTARIWAAATGQPLARVMQHLREVNHAEFSRDGQRVLTASNDGTARVWDTATGESVTPPLPHGDSLTTASFSPDGRRVVTASADGTARVWDLAAGAPVLLTLRHRGNGEWIPPPTLRDVISVDHAAFSPNGRRVVTVSYDQTARVWDADTGRPVTPTLQHFDAVTSAAFGPDSGHVVTASGDGTLRLWDAVAGHPIAPPMRNRGPLGFVAFSPDGRRLVTANGRLVLSSRRPPGEPRVWDAATGQPITPPLLHGHKVFHALFSPDSRRVVTAGDDATARVWDAATGRLAFLPLQHRNAVVYAAFSPDGRLLVTVSSRRPENTTWATPSEVQVWDATTGRQVGSPMPQRGYVGYAAFSPDGRRLVTASRLWLPPPLPCEARVWDVATRQPVTPPLHHDGDVLDAAFSPDGGLVATASFDRTARVWDALTGEPVTPPLRHNAYLRRVAFSPDGRRLVTASADGTARLWDLRPDRRPAADLKRLARLLAGQRIDGDTGSMPVHPKLVHSDWQSLQRNASMRAGASVAQIMAWHQREEEDAERAHEWLAALPHLDFLIEANASAWEYPLARGRLLARQRRWDETRGALAQAVARAPRDRELWIRCGSVWAEAGRWDEAAAAFARAIDLGAVGLAWRWHTLALLGAGDTGSYRRACAELLTRHGRTDDPIIALAIATACVYAPNAVTDSAQPIHLAEQTVENGPLHEPPTFPTLAFALYRGDRCPEVLQRVVQGITKTPPDSRIFFWLLLSMTHQRLGHAEDARQYLRRAVEWESQHGSDLDWYKRLEIQLLRREAEALLKGSAP